MFKLVKYLRLREWIFFLISIVFIIAQVWLNLKIPDYTKEITILVQTPGSEMKEVWRVGGLMLLCALGSAGAAVIVGYLSSMIAANLDRQIRYHVFDKVVNFSNEEINQFSTASLLTRSTNDVTQVRSFIGMGLQLIIYAPIMAGWAIAKIANKNWQWSAATAIAVVLLLTVIIILIILVLPKFKRIQVLTDNLNKVTRENLTGLRVVRAYNAEKHEEAKFDVANKDLSNTHLFTSRIMGIMNPAMSLIMSGLALSIYWLGMYIINQANMLDKTDLFGDMIIFSQYAMQVVMSFMMLTLIFIMYPRASVSSRRINEVLATKPSITDGAFKAKDAKSHGVIELKNVNFKYPGASEYVLENINLKINQGETVAFIGSTGSGKSTLINIIPRFFDATEGDVIIDGINIKDYKLEELHNKLGYVSQRAVLFSGTIKSNIAYGKSQKEITDDDITSALQISQGLDFVMQMENGLDSPIAQGGTNLSGGQKQRVSIARALAKKPDILIFDDSFSALDYRTDKELRSQLKQETKNVTKLIVAQRIGTIMDVDKIVVLDSGKIVGIGTHEELLKTCKIYQEIAYSQLSEEELQNA
jgi:ATP-binding cassette subfamily B protein